MAKRRRKKTKKRTFKNEAIALGVLVVTLFGIFRLGFVGRLIAQLMRLLVGELYLPVFVGLALAMVWLFLTGRGPNLRNRLSQACLWLLPLLALILHSWYFSAFADQGQSLINVTWSLATEALRQGSFSQSLGGGMLGALLYTVSYFTLGQVGTYVLIFIAILVLLCFVMNISWQEFLEGIQMLWTVFSDWFSNFLADSKESLQKQSEKRQAKAKQKAKQPEAKEKKNRIRPKKERTDQEAQPAPREPVEIVGLSSSQSSGGSRAKSSPSQQEAPAQAAAPAQNIPLKFEYDEEEEEDHEDLADMKMEAEEENPNYRLPQPDLLNDREETDQSGEYSVIQHNIEKLEETFESFNVDAKVVKANLGPAVTKFEIQPAIGTKVSKITNLADDIALALAAKDIRIEAPIPGKSAIGIEVPNQQVSLVALRDSLENAPKSPKLLEVPLGRSIAGSIQMADLAKMPHLLVAGSTGSGKSVCINGIIISILMKAKPHEVKLMMIDPKKVELNVYNGIPHLLTPVVTNPRKAAQALNKIVAEMERRYELFAETGARNMKGYNQHIREKNREEGTDDPCLPYIVVIVDELADLMMVASKEVEAAIIRLAQMARAAGIHMILATQRPSVDVITGIIKANVPSRIAFAVSSGTDSRTIIDQNGAEKLLGRGDMLFMPMGEGKPIRVQGAFIDDDEVERVVDFVKSQQEANYVEAMMPSEASEENPADELDEIWPDAMEFVKGRDTVSTSMMQRRFRIGYNRAARIIDDMEQRGIIGPANGSKPRVVNISDNSDEPSQAN
ncbi:DNA translocase FtsK [Aerococcus sanguinicola]|uniref:DNA translocase FtsK n=1 Tax=Aerococcus sanguinicola TaxID=119206 RepID=UPI0018A7115C|nr:DNA translocase FtsK [Aerococcus sanguinicola]